MAWKFDHCLPSKQQPIVNKQDELKECVKSFFEDFLDIREESDSGRIFAPITVSCCRALETQKLGRLLERMRVLSGATWPPCVAQDYLNENSEVLGDLDTVIEDIIERNPDWVAELSQIVESKEKP